ncbi:MAG TPA: hypothetical protein DCZ40_12775 [Lachnospiraceae bacterium]|nr:hypothetical protein [Lachnospiraceae bacterium]
MILLYHKVNELQQDYNNLAVTLENFKYQLELIEKYFPIVPLSEHREGTIAITFDDGFQDVLKNASPYLNSKGIPATIFITTGQIGKQEELWTTELLRLIFTGNHQKQKFYLELPSFCYEFAVGNLEEKYTLYLALRRLCMKSDDVMQQDILGQLRDWSEQKEAGREEYAFLTEEEIAELSGNKLITIGAHTVHHVSLGTFPKEYQEKEIYESKKKLEQITGHQIYYFSYPFGSKNDYNADTIKVLKKEGFRQAYTAVSQPGRDKDYEIPRIAVPNIGKGEFDEWFYCTILQKVPQDSLKSKKVTYIGKLEHDKALINGNDGIAIFGAGGRGQKLLRDLRAYGKEEKVKYFIDNDESKQGSYLLHKKVIPIEEIDQDEIKIILVDSVWEKEMIDQLVDQGIEGIHWILR